MKKTRELSSIKRASTANVEAADSIALHASTTAVLNSDPMGTAGPSTPQDNMNGDISASSDPSQSPTDDETSNRSEHQDHTSTPVCTDGSQTTDPVLSSGSSENTRIDMRHHAAMVPDPDMKDRDSAHSSSCDVHHDCANHGTVNNIHPHGGTNQDSIPIDDNSVKQPAHKRGRRARKRIDFEASRWHWRPDLPQYVNDSPLYEHRRRLQYLMPKFGFFVPFGHEWFRSEDDARLFLQATAKYVDKANIHISKQAISPLFHDLFRKACDLYKMRLPLAERPMHVNSAIGLGFAELCTHKSDTGHAFREKKKTVQQKELEVKESEGVYRGTDLSQLRSAYWSKLQETSIIGKYLTENAGREAEHITRHVILGVLEASPEFYILKGPAKTMVLIKNASLSKEQNLILEGKLALSSSPLAEVVRELHREFLRYDDSEITEFSNENEREEMSCQPMTDNEFDSIRIQHIRTNITSITGPTHESKGIPWLTKGDQRRVAKGLQPRGKGVGHRGPGKKRKYGEYSFSEQKNSGGLKEDKEVNLPLRPKLKHGEDASGTACMEK